MHTTISKNDVRDDIEGYFLVLSQDPGKSYLSATPAVIHPQYVGAPDLIPDDELFVLNEDQGADLNVKCSRSVRENKSVGDLIFARDLRVVQSSGDKLFLWSDNVETIEGNPALEALKDQYTKGNFYHLKQSVTPQKPKNTKTKGSTVTKKSPLDRHLKNFPVPTIEDDGWYVDKGNWAQLLLNTLEFTENTLMVGPSGTGKTELIMLLAEKLGRNSDVVDMAGMQDATTSFHGTHRIGTKGSFFDPAKFTKNIQRNMLMLMDEINRAPGSATNMLFSVFDNRRSLNIPNAMDDKESIISVHPDLRFFATANEGITYTSAGIMDQALRDRFPSVIELDYLPQDIERDVLIKKTDVSKEIADKICGIAQVIREDYKDDGTLQKGIGLRQTQLCAKYAFAGMSFMDSLMRTFYTAYNTAEEKEFVLQVIQKG